MEIFLFTVLALLLFFSGASVFSFLGVVAYRVPLGISFIKGRSFCPSCEETLRAADMIPVLSWLFLRGKCRKCGAPIPVSSLISEAAGGAALILCMLFACGGDVYAITTLNMLRGLLHFAAIGVLYIITVVDLKTQEIPDEFNIALAVLGLLSVPLLPEVTILERVIGIFSASLILFIVAMIAGGAFGGGDIKMMAAAGILLGWKFSLLALFIAIITGGGFAIVMLALGKFKKTDRFAFGPYLCAGIAASIFAGNAILSWYFSLLY